MEVKFFSSPGYAKDAKHDSRKRPNSDYQSKNTFRVLWIQSGDHSKNDTNNNTNV